MIMFRSLWTQKLILFEVYRKLIRRLWYYKPVTITYFFILTTTLIACIVVTLTECRPLSLYWTIPKDPEVKARQYC
jgi:hypothetical protein